MGFILPSGVGLKKSFPAVQTLLGIGSSNEELLTNSIDLVEEVDLHLLFIIFNFNLIF